MGYESTLVSAGRGGTGWDLYLGLDVGAVRTQSGNREREASKNGYLLGIKGLTSLYLEKSALDLGGGWFFSKIRGGPAQADDERPDFKHITTQSGFFELAARYRVEKSLWEIGPLAKVAFGDDSRFSPFPADPEPNVFLGISLLRTWREDTLATRWGLDALTDVTVSGRQVFLLNLNGQLGVSLLRSQPKVFEKVVERRTETFAVTQVNGTATPPSTPPPAVTVYGPTVNFPKDKTTLTQEDTRYIQAFAALLKEHDSFWTTIDVAGHADRRGPRELNEKYSRLRAQAVIAALKAAGIPENRMTVSHHAFDKPLDPGDRRLELARNRRTEIVIQCKENSIEMSKRMEDLRRRFHTPTTCLLPGCP